MNAIMEYLKACRETLEELTSSQRQSIVVSNSGRNAVPIAMAIEARQREVPVIAVTSLAYSRQVSSRQASGEKLYEVADVVIDNGAPYRDAVVKLEDVPQPVGSLSTVTGAALLHPVMVGAAEPLIDHVSPPPVFWSGKSGRRSSEERTDDESLSREGAVLVKSGKALDQMAVLMTAQMLRAKCGSFYRTVP